MPNYADILLVNPYEKPVRFGVQKEEFIKEIQVVTDEYLNFGNQFISEFKESAGSKIFYFFTGFPGAGKTTFINWFINELEKNEQVYFQFDSSKILTQNINLSFKTTSRKDYFEQLILDIVKKKFTDYKKPLQFIVNNRHQFESEFHDFLTKRQIIEALLSLDKIKDEDQFNLLWQKFSEGLTPYSLILLCLLEKSLKLIEEKEFCFFCIDNLDALTSDYLANGFWSDYFKAFVDLLSIGEQLKWPEIRYRFKIVFVMRQYNYNLLIENIITHARDLMLSFLHDSFYFVQENINAILKRRRDYAMRKNIEIHNDIDLFIDVILNEDDRYRRIFYMPLFNYDIRKINQKIIEVCIEKKKINFDFDKKSYEYLFDNEAFKNGARGIIIHGLIKVLFSSSLEKYPVDPIIHNEFDDGQPFCSYCRMLLTLIFNLSFPNNKISKDDRNLRDVPAVVFSLDKLIHSLRIYDDNSSIIPYENVFDWLAKFHSLKNKTFTHLVEISKDFKNDFDSTLDFTEELEISKNTSTSNLRSTKLRNIKIKINPSAIIYLTYVVRHFEYLAAINYWENDRFPSKTPFNPLFLSINLLPDSKKYEFEKLLTDVIEMVRKKKRGNDLFLTNNVFVSTSKIKNIPDYLKSNFTLHLEDSPDMLYSSRVITTHLSYIEAFRNYLNTNPVIISLIEENNKIISSKNQTEVNKFILNIEIQYINLFLENSITLIDQSVYRVIKKWELSIRKCLRSNDFLKPIDINSDF